MTFKMLASRELANIKIKHHIDQKKKPAELDNFSFYKSSKQILTQM